MTNLLEIQGLNTFYGESHILRDVDLSVKSGEMVCLIGRNGVGKTTLLKSLIGLLRPCLLYTSPSPRDLSTSRMPSSA